MPLSCYYSSSEPVSLTVCPNASAFLSAFQLVCQFADLKVCPKAGACRLVSPHGAADVGV